MTEEKKPDEVRLESLEYPDKDGALKARVSSPAIAALAAEAVELFRKEGGVNFVEFTMGSEKHPEIGMFSMTIQRREGKTPAERFTEVSKELEASKGREADLRTVVEKCQDVFARFCGEMAPMIAHPKKCRFYIQLREKDCNCSAKDVANDVLLALKDCRAATGTASEPRCICATGFGMNLSCPQHKPGA